MAKGFEVLQMLCAGKEWTISEDDYESIIWKDDKVLLTKEQFEAGFAKYDTWKAQQDADKAAEKAALLDRLGITEAEAKLLLS